jgi:low affinity Fe/Cu permease
MTKQQEIDIVRFVNSSLKWFIGIAVTIVTFIIVMKVSEVKSDARFKGEIETKVSNIEEDIDEINKKIDNEITAVRIEEEKRNRDESKMLKDLTEDLNHIEFFLAKKLDYKPIIRSSNYLNGDN